MNFLPEALIVNNKEYEINTDYRIALTIFEALEDNDLTKEEQVLVILDLLFNNAIAADDIEEALKQASWFLDGGRKYKSADTAKRPIISWTQDEQNIFSAVNKVANAEVRSIDYMHWWTFLGHFNEIGEGPLTTVVQIRQKLNEGKKLDKSEQKYYKNHKDEIDILTKEEREEKEKSRELIKSLYGL